MNIRCDDPAKLQQLGGEVVNKAEDYSTQIAKIYQVLDQLSNSWTGTKSQNFKSKMDNCRKEFNLLKYLIENKNIAITRENLLLNVWEYDYYGEDRTIDTHIETLRNHLGKYRDTIKTVRGMGYKFTYAEKTN